MKYHFISEKIKFTDNMWIYIPYASLIYINKKKYPFMTCLNFSFANIFFWWSWYLKSNNTLFTIVIEDEEKTAAKEQGEELSLPESDQGSEPTENGDPSLAGDAAKQDVQKLPKDPVTLSWEETK